MIKVENLSRQYGAKKALDGLSFTAENGSVLGFIGMSARISRFLPENAPLHAGMNVLAFLRYCGKMHGLSGEELHSAVDDSVEKCRLGSVLYEELEALSKAKLALEAERSQSDRRGRELNENVLNVSITPTSSLFAFSTSSRCSVR